MELYEFLEILDRWFDSKIAKETDESRRKSAKSKIQGIIGFFNYSESESTGNPNDDPSSILNDATDNWCSKIWSGSESLSAEDVSAIKMRISADKFDLFLESVNMTEDSEEDFIQAFAKAGKKISKETLAQDVTNVLKEILDEIVKRKTMLSATKLVRVVNGYAVMTNGKKVRLAEELKVPTAVQSEEKYAYVLLKVYGQDAKKADFSLEDLSKESPKYIANFELSRNDYFKACYASRQLRDVFYDGESLFSETEKEALSIIQSTLTAPWKNAFERLSQTMNLVIDANLYSENSLGHRGLGMVGASEKRGMVHMMVNDGKVKWIVSYDTDI
jgi:hypothetical protein